MNPKISVDYATLKSALRSGLSAEGREYWWPILLNVTDQKFSVRDYPDVAGSAERLLVMSCSVSPMVTLKKETTPEKKYQLLLETLASSKSAGDSKSCPIVFLKCSLHFTLFLRDSYLFSSTFFYLLFGSFHVSKVLCWSQGLCK